MKEQRKPQRGRKKGKEGEKYGVGNRSKILEDVMKRKCASGRKTRGMKEKSNEEREGKWVARKKDKGGRLRMKENMDGY